MYGEPRDIENSVIEERSFTNPHVRFRRINGRIVPIYNKKRIGQTVSGQGEKLMGVGALVAGGAYAAKKLKVDQVPMGTVLPNALKKLGGLFASKATDGFKAKFAKGLVRHGGKSAKFLVSNPYKSAAALAITGLGLKLLGDETQMRSRFGKDYFSIDDEHGMGS